MTALAALVLATTLQPIAVRAETATTQNLDLTTRQFDVMSAGEFEGRLRMRITPDGIVAGTFMDSEGGLSSIIGGLDGTKIWIDLGNAAPTSQHLFNGTLIDGKLEAGAAHGLHTWTLEGTPRTH
jgi:hypothetical protein